MDDSGSRLSFFSLSLPPPYLPSHTSALRPLAHPSLSHALSMAKDRRTQTTWSNVSIKGGALQGGNMLLCCQDTFIEQSVMCCDHGARSMAGGTPHCLCSATNPDQPPHILSSCPGHNIHHLGDYDQPK